MKHSAHEPPGDRSSNRRAPRLLGAAVLLGLLVFGAAPASAQYRYRAAPRGHYGVAVFPPGLYMGVGAMATSILAQSGGQELLEDGGGLSFFLGMRLSPQLSIEGGLSTSLHNPVEVDTNYGADFDYLHLNAGTVDAKVHFPRDNSNFTPFAQGGLGLYLLDSTYFGTQSVGTGFQLGGGFDVAVGPNVDFGVRALYRGISMGPPDTAEDDTFISALSAEANLSLHF